MLATFTYSPGSCIRCGGADGYELSDGDVVKVYLNQDRNEAFPEWIEGIVVGVTQTSPTDTSRTYTVQYETDDLEEAALLIAACDVLSLICTSCCEILQEQLDAWAAADEPQVTLSYNWEEDGTIKLTATAYSRQPGVTLDTYSWIDTDGNAMAPSGPASQAFTIVPDSASIDYLGGRYGVTVTDSVGHTAQAFVNVVPTRLMLRTENGVLLTGSSTSVFDLNAGEYIVSLAQLTPGSGVQWESVTYAGTAPRQATLQFTNTPAVAAVDFQCLIIRALP